MPSHRCGPLSLTIRGPLAYQKDLSTGTMRPRPRMIWAIIRRDTIGTGHLWARQTIVGLFRIAGRSS